MPNQKSLQLPSYISRLVPAWTSPAWLEAERWRQLIVNQPVAGICMSTLIADIQSSDWEIRPIDSQDEDALASDIDYYTSVINPKQLPGALSGFDNWITYGLQDLLTLPVGMTYEVVRYDPAETLGLSQPNPRGHVYKVIYIDGATILPTYNDEFPVMQKIQEDITKSVFFSHDEIARTVMLPHPELRRWGYGMAPPERVFLAINMLYRSDQYYANLLLDTPEAGILDIPLSEHEAQEWLIKARELFTGIDPLKIPILYDTERPPNYISFGRPPTEMLLNEQTIKYAQITAAGYGLTITDIGLGDPQKTLAGSIRDERKSKRSGFNVIKEKVRNFINLEILPDYLEFVWIENDEETRTMQGRSFMMFTTALEKAKNSGFITEQQGLEELKKNGFISTEAELPDVDINLLPPPTNDSDVTGEMERVPVSEGGRGDIVSRAELGEDTIASVDRDSEMFGKMAGLFIVAFEEMMNRMDIEPLIRIALEEEFDTIELTQMSDWLDNRLEHHFINKAENGPLDKALDKNKWWQIIIDLAELALVYRQAFSEGAVNAANIAWRTLFDAGEVDTPNPIGFNFNLINTQTLRKLDQNAAQLVTRVNDGTKFFINRIIKSGVDQGLSSPNIVQLIQDGGSIDDILNDTDFSSQVQQIVGQEIQNMTENRIASIVNTEIARAETDGRVEMWQQMGLTQKRWRHTGPDTPCRFCQANIDLGFVSIDHLYTTVFGPEQSLGPPAHPQVDHCSIEFNEKELVDNAADLELWDGS